MLENEADRPAFKDWLIPKLEKISDAEPDVLADYVIALVVADETEDEVKQHCLLGLSDFLQEHTAPFVDEVIAAVKKRSFLPKARRAVHPADPLLPSPALSATAQSFTPAAAPSTQSQQQPGLPIPGHTTSPLSTRGERSRKRRRNDRDASQQSDGQDHPHKRAGGGDRPVKQNGRMGARNGRGGHVGYGGQDGNPAWIPTGGQNDMPMGAMPNFAGPPLPPPRFQQLDMSNPTTFSQLDMSNPATFFQMMQVMQMGFPGMPGMAPVMPSAMNQAASNSNSNRLGQSENRQGMCKAYETQGACRDFACPYEHHGSIVPTLRADGTFTSSFTTPSPSPFQGASRSRFQPPPLAADDNPDTIPEYDPNHASLALQGLKGSNGQQGTGKGRGRSDGTSKGRPRASFSMSGPSYDRENSTVVVEQIPEEHFTEIDVRRYFSQFGNIVEVNMQAYKRLAVVKFDDYASARLAYDSPKAVFQNRFVKVYWYKPETLPQPSAKHNDPSASEVPEGEEVIDRVEIEKRQAEAQKVFEEKRKKAKEAEARAEEVERQLKEKEDQLRELRDQLAKKSKSASEADQEATLIDQLSSLQAEAQDLNADYGTYSRGRGRGRGRGGGFRGRGLYAPRARGGYRGRGYHTSAFPGGRSSVKRLDNRPKRIAISGVEVGTEKDEALRQHLLNHYECDSIDPHPDRADTQIITFKERYMAEMFLNHASDIPDVGQVELAWVPNAPNAANTATPTSDRDGDVKMSDMPDTKTEEAHADDQTTSGAQAQGDDTVGNGNGGEADYDVADDEDRWMAT